MVDFLKVFIGSYEHYVLRYDIQLVDSPKNADKKDYNFVNIFTQQNHTASVKCIDNHGRYLATGGVDDRISIIDLKLNREIQRISIHDGTVNSVKFSPDGSYLFSTSDDGKIVAIKTGSWITHKIWKSPHTGKAVWGISIHPSGKLALTLGNDMTIRTWNLLKGKQTCTTYTKGLLQSNQGNNLEALDFSPSGNKFSTIGGKGLVIVSIETGDIIRTEFCKSNITSICWISDESLLLGHQNGFITFVRFDCEDTAEFDCTERDDYNKDNNGKLIDNQSANGTRIKQMSLHNNLLITLMSCGALTIWRFTRKTCKLKYIKSINIGCRPICMKVLDALAETSQLFPMPIEIPSNDIIKTENNNDEPKSSKTIEKKQKKQGKGK